MRVENIELLVEKSRYCVDQDQVGWSDTAAARPQTAAECWGALESRDPEFLEV